MAKRRRISKYQLVTTLVIAGVFIGTIFATFIISPEDILAESDDGIVRVEGFAKAGTSVEIEKQTQTLPPFPPVLGDVYRIHIDGQPLPPSFVVRFRYNEDAVAVFGQGSGGGVSVMVYDTRLLAWRYLPTVVDVQEQTVTAEVPPGLNAQLWSYGIVSSGVAPENADVLLDELISFPPEGAVGYIASDAFGSEEIDYIVRNIQLDRGGCDGVYRTGKEETMTSKEVHWDGNTYRIIVYWQIDEGCSEGEIMRSQYKSSTD